MDFVTKCGGKKYIFDGKTLALYEGAKTSEKIAVDSGKLTKNSLSKAVINVDQVCNARCKYCYESHKNEIMSIKAAELIVNKLGVYTSIECVSFFGGEPLLNFSVIKYIVKNLSCRSKVGKYEVTTNGVMINQDVIDFFARYNFRVIVSLDGPRDIHNALRVGCDYDAVIEHINKMRILGIEIVANCTVTQYHMDNIGIRKLTEYFENLSIKYIFSKVITDDYKLKLSEQMSKYEEIDYEYKHLVDSKNRVCNNRYVSGIIEALVEHRGSVSFCDDLLMGICFDTDGKACACNRFLGNVKVDEKELMSLNDKSQTRKCKECWAERICSFCVADVYQNKILKKQNEKFCYRRELYEYALRKIIEYYDCDITMFQKIIDHYYMMR